MMLRRRLAAILVTALLGANTAAASVCEAYCAGTGTKNAGHHHQTEPRSFAHSHQAHAHHPSANCPECLKSARRLFRRQDCRSFAQVQTLLETARASSSDRKDSQLEVSCTPTSSLPKRVENARFTPLHPPPKISSFAPVLLS